MMRRSLGALLLTAWIVSCRHQTPADRDPVVVAAPVTVIAPDSLARADSAAAGLDKRLGGALAPASLSGQHGAVNVIGGAAGGVKPGAPVPLLMAPMAQSAAVDRELTTADELVVYAEPAQSGTVNGASITSRIDLAQRKEAYYRANGARGKDGRREFDASRGGGSLTGEPVTQGTLRARDDSGSVVGEFPLRHTQVAAEVSGYLARTVVEQKYTNPFAQPIEAVYIFPLPAMAAVNDFVMEVGARRIVGIVRPREEAERIYADARARGQVASLLTQERPNIFTQSVANIAPGASVTIRLGYVERLVYDHGEYSYIFPMVVGPRYVGGGTPVIASSNGGATVQPASTRPVIPSCMPPGLRPRDIRTEINPPVLPPGTRSGNDIGLTITLNAAVPVRKVASVAHHVAIDAPSPERRVITLAHDDSLPNRDFVLRWSVGGSATEFGVLSHRDRTGGFFTLAMQPPAAPRDDQVTPREITFIMDVSGSMMGWPIETAKGVVRQTLDRLRPDDRFNLVYFASGNAQLWDRARSNTPENIAEARRFLESVQAGGGTEMMAGVRRALSAPHDPRYLQMYVFATDGYVGEDQDILKAVRTERGDARFFAFGIGSSVNRFLIDGVGEYGGGASFVVMPRDSGSVETSVGRLFAAIDSPVLVDIAIDWNGLPVQDVYPAATRDLFAGQTINVVGRFTRAARGTAYVTGRVGARNVRYPVAVDFPDSMPANAALAPTWARWRIEELSGRLMTADSDAQAGIRDEITALAVEFRLVSQYTAFVAVDDSTVVGEGRPVRIDQPVTLPESVSWKGVFGERHPRPQSTVGARPDKPSPPKP